MILARQRLGKLGVLEWHIHLGDATKSHDIAFENFRPNYKSYDELNTNEQLSFDMQSIPLAGNLW